MPTNSTVTNKNLQIENIATRRSGSLVSKESIRRVFRSNTSNNTSNLNIANVPMAQSMDSIHKAVANESMKRIENDIY